MQELPVAGDAIDEEVGIWREILGGQEGFGWEYVWEEGNGCALIGRDIAFSVIVIVLVLGLFGFYLQSIRRSVQTGVIVELVEREAISVSGIFDIVWI